MRRTPEGNALGATAGGVMLVTGAAVLFLIYAMLTAVDLLPSSPVIQDLVGLAH